MSLITVSIQVPEELWQQVQELAAANEATSDAVVYTALTNHFEPDEETRLAIEEGIRQADAGQFIEHEEVLRWFEEKKRKAAEAA
jgi:predicted transcriptional regulator